MVVFYWDVGTTSRSHLEGGPIVWPEAPVTTNQRCVQSWTVKRSKTGWLLNTGPIGCGETSVTKYKSTLFFSPRKAKILTRYFVVHNLCHHYRNREILKSAMSDSCNCVRRTKMQIAIWNGNIFKTEHCHWLLIYIYIYIYIYTHSKTCLNRTPYIPETWTNGK